MVEGFVPLTGQLSYGQCQRSSNTILGETDCKGEFSQEQEIYFCQ